MKNKSIKKEFCTPTKFEVILQNRSKDCLETVVRMLIERGTSDFQWEFVMAESHEEYRLSIQSSWADNLAEIAKLLGDYGIEDE